MVTRPRRLSPTPKAANRPLAATSRPGVLESGKFRLQYPRARDASAALQAVESARRLPSVPFRSTRADDAAELPSLRDQKPTITSAEDGQMRPAPFPMMRMLEAAPFGLSRPPRDVGDRQFVACRRLDTLAAIFEIKARLAPAQPERRQRSVRLGAERAMRLPALGRRHADHPAKGGVVGRVEWRLVGQGGGDGVGIRIEEIADRRGQLDAVQRPVA